MAYATQRIFNLAERLHITVSEAARLCGKKGARVRRERARQCACVQTEPVESAKAARIRAARWDLREDLA